MNHFRFTVPGQPLSWNTSYRHGIRRVTNKHGQPVLDQNLQPKRAAMQWKANGVEAWQLRVKQIVETSKPTGFAPENQIIIGYQMYLARNLDADNVMKMLNDSIAKGLGMNDSRFLPVTLLKQTGVKDPRVTVLVFDADYWFPTVAANTPDAEFINPQS